MAHPLGKALARDTATASRPPGTGWQPVLQSTGGVKGAKGPDGSTGLQLRVNVRWRAYQVGQEKPGGGGISRLGFLQQGAG